MTKAEETSSPSLFWTSVLIYYELSTKEPLLIRLLMLEQIASTLASDCSSFYLSFSNYFQSFKALRLRQVTSAGFTLNSSATSLLLSALTKTE